MRRGGAVINSGSRIGMARSMRASLVLIVVVVLLASLALYGVNPNFNLTV